VLDRPLAIGTLLTVGGFFLIAGPESIAPHFERYAMCLVAPSALVIARGATWWLECRGVRGRIVTVACCAAVAWSLLASFYGNYFRFIECTGGQAHLTFHTAVVEPKLQALQHVLRQRDRQQPAWIVVQEWWNYWPLQYLAMGQSEVHVVDWDHLPADQRSGHCLAAGEVWFVEFTLSQAAQAAKARLETLGLAVREETIADFSGRALISVISAAKKFPELLKPAI
jgi:hypothetical protein